MFWVDSLPWVSPACTGSTHGYSRAALQAAIGSIVEGEGGFGSAEGDGGGFVEGTRLRFDDQRKPALNTDGGGLSSNHTGRRGMYLLLEATRQMRGESTSQVRDAKLAVAHGNGGNLGGGHSGGTVILARD